MSEAGTFVRSFEEDRGPYFVRYDVTLHDLPPEALMDGSAPALKLAAKVWRKDEGGSDGRDPDFWINIYGSECAGSS